MAQHKPVYIVALTQHRIISLHADNKIYPDHSKGGVVRFVSTVETPEDIKLLNLKDSFSIALTLECTGNDGESKEPAFIAFCKAVGVFSVIQCPKDGIETIGNDALWTTSASQLMPLISSYVAEQIERMGYKNINVPPFIPVGPEKTESTEAKATKPKRSSKTKAKQN